MVFILASNAAPINAPIVRQKKYTLGAYDTLLIFSFKVGSKPKRSNSSFVDSIFTPTSIPTTATIPKNNNNIRLFLSIVNDCFIDVDLAFSSRSTLVSNSHTPDNKTIKANMAEA